MMNPLYSLWNNALEYSRYRRCITVTVVVPYTRYRPRGNYHSYRGITAFPITVSFSSVGDCVFARSKHWFILRHWNIAEYDRATLLPSTYHWLLFSLSPFPKCIIIMHLSCHVFFATVLTTESNKFTYQTV